jgi:hypothetical protein
MAIEDPTKPWASRALRSNREAQVTAWPSKRYQLETHQKHDPIKPAGRKSDEMNGFS